MNTNPVKIKLTHSHDNMKRLFGVARPGKTAKMKNKGHEPHRKNRRIWNSFGTPHRDENGHVTTGEWVKA